MTAPAKINLALVVGSRRPDGKHEVATVLQRVGLCDRLELEAVAAPGIRIDGFSEDTIVRAALEALAAEAGVAPAWHVRLEKRIPVAGGLGGGSSDAAAALRQANAALPEPLPPERLLDVAASVGTDVPFFLVEGTHLGLGDGSVLSPLRLPCDYTVLLALPEGAAKSSTASVYEAFDERNGDIGFADRRSRLLETVRGVVSARDLARLPANDLTSSPLAAELEGMGAFRADVSGAGPTVYALFDAREHASDAARRIEGRATTWIVDALA